MSTDLQPFLAHVQELKTRVLWCLLAVAVGSCVGYIYYAPLLALLLKPLHQPLYYSSPAGGFDVLFNVCIGAGLLLAIPVCVYHLFRFISPLLSPNVKRRLPLFIISSSVLMIAGIAFAYGVSIPAALNFLNSFESDQVHSLISAREYFSFLLRYILGFGIVFQLPLVLLLINAGYRLSVRSLLTAGRLVILASFVAAAILSPTPDVVNQSILAIPIIALYYLSVVLIWWVNRRTKI